MRFVMGGPSGDAVWMERREAYAQKHAAQTACIGAPALCGLCTCMHTPTSGMFSACTRPTTTCLIFFILAYSVSRRRRLSAPHSMAALPPAMAALLAAVRGRLPGPVPGVAGQLGRAFCAAATAGTAAPSPEPRLPPGPGLQDFLRMAAGTAQPGPPEQPHAALPGRQRVYIETYGCQMNLSDSEARAQFISSRLA